MIGAIAVLGCRRHQRLHHRAGITGAGTDPHPLCSQCLQHRQHTRDGGGEAGHSSNLQRHKGVIEVVHLGVAHGVTEAGLPALIYRRQTAQGGDVIPLAKAHGLARFLQAHGEVIGAGEGLDEDGGGGEGAEIDDGAGPVEDQCLHVCGRVYGNLQVSHGDVPVSVKGRSRRGRDREW
ncbi:hypothetical protein D3C85_1363310 [compost metagenome]